ncbi:MAG: hypothetical protein HYV26_21050 [Candidatus Hydrogenedentes bacterium]|nr:hypothetical protein [Candidatus Hydrogenedentota bacterium]
MKQRLVSTPQPFTPHALASQWRRLMPLLCLLYVPTLAVLLLLFGYWFFTRNDVSLLTRDPLAVVETELLKIQQHPEMGIHALGELKLPLFTGFVSNLGVLLWASVVTACLLGWWISRANVTPRYSPRYLGSAGLISLLLLADDLFLLHERVLSQWFGLDEKVLFGAYALALATHLLVFSADVLRSDFLLLGLAFLFLAGSLSVDLLPVSLPQPHFFEDGAKFTGILSWAGYHWHTVRQQLSPGNS